MAESSCMRGRRRSPLLDRKNTWIDVHIMDNSLAACREPKGRLGASPGGLLHFWTQCGANKPLLQGLKGTSQKWALGARLEPRSRRETPGLDDAGIRGCQWTAKV